MNESIIARMAAVVRSVDSAIEELNTGFLSGQELQSIVDTGYFNPQQNETCANWFSEFLALRSSLWEVIDETHDRVTVGLRNLETYDEYRYFIVGFSAACLVVRLDRMLLEDVAVHSMIQRKFNEAFPEKNIPRKQYTRVYNSFVDIDNAQRMYLVMTFASKERSKIKILSVDKEVGYLVDNLWRYRSYLDPSRQNYLERGINFIKHAIKRRGASIRQHTEFKLLETSGRIASEFRNKQGKLVTKEIRKQAKSLLQPGDILVTRHKYALTNFVLPGFWPHAALYVGDQSQREHLGIDLPVRVRQKLRGNESTFEALKDGVLFRTLESTLDVDTFAILRPTISTGGVSKAIERIAIHEGKGYNFDLDFFRSDRLVCTEILYRAFDGIEHMNIELKERAGRPTLTAEDVLDLALDTDMLEAIAIYGVGNSQGLVTEKERVINLLIESYRDGQDP